MRTGPEVYDIVTKTAERRELSRPVQDEIKRILRASGLVWKCAECDLRPWCVRCHGSALNEDGDLLGPSLIACENARARKAAMSGRRR